MMDYEYVKNYYGVPAETGRRVLVSGKPGIIIEDRGHYIGVNFDDSKPGHVDNCHPTSEVEYLGIGKIRKPTRSQARHQRYLREGDLWESFGDFLKYGYPGR